MEAVGRIGYVHRKGFVYSLFFKFVSVSFLSVMLVILDSHIIFLSSLLLLYWCHDVVANHNLKMFNVFAHEWNLLWGYRNKQFCLSINYFSICLSFGLIGYLTGKWNVRTSFYVCWVSCLMPVVVHCSFLVWILNFTTCTSCLF